MILDGARALTFGDYVTPSSGRYAGQLGPWSAVVQGMGIDPRSSLMKVAFVVIGAVHLLGAGAVAVSASPAAVWLAGVAALSGLWYLPVGTLGDAIVLLILALTPSLKPWA